MMVGWGVAEGLTLMGVGRLSLSFSLSFFFLSLSSLPLHFFVTLYVCPFSPTCVSLSLYFLLNIHMITL